jgi:nitroimidazol reductase NimA-like FMN-containing flavoprotein (pyridoxamine 5'-phosphate oxidase superfamily)
MPRKRAQGQSVVASGEPRSVSHAEGQTVRTSTTDDASTRRLEERLRTGSFHARDNVAVLSHSHGKHGEP